MKINKVLNNNFIIVIDELENEKILGGKGIAFGKRAGDMFDTSVVNKTFVVPQNSEVEKFERYLEFLPTETIDLSLRIVEFAQVKLTKSINETVCLAIADHILSAIERYNNDIRIPNYMLWEIKNFYQAEYEVGEYAIELISEQLGVQLPDDEAGFIATHIIDSELDNSNIDQVYKTTKLIKDVINLVKYNFGIDYDQDSIYYYRFITHLKFFAERLFNNYTIPSDEDNRLFEVIKDTYFNSFECAEKIEKYIHKEYSYLLSKEELIYLSIHIENVVYKAKK